MELFATARDRLAFLLETDAALDLDFETLEALAGEVSEEQPPLGTLFNRRLQGGQAKHF